MTMKAGTSSGSYVGSLTVRTKADYRAVYRKTTTEGTRTSASAAVAISVTASCTQLPCPLSVGPADR